MNEIVVVNESEVLGQNVRVYGSVDEPLFLAKDVAEWIEHSNPRMMISVVDEEEKVKRPLPVNNAYGVSQVEETWFLTEDGLYEVLMQSRKPQAKIFKSEIKKILKTIRKHGAYMTPEKIEEVLLNPDTIIKLATELKAEREKTNLLESKIEQDKPKVEFYEAVGESQTTILVRELAKILHANGIEAGQNRLFQSLRENGFLISKWGLDYNMPTQKAMELGLFRIKETPIQNSEGKITIKKTVRVTPKGQQYFVKYYREKGVI